MLLDGGHGPLSGGRTASAVGIETRGGVLTPLIRAGDADGCKVWIAPASSI